MRYLILLSGKINSGKNQYAEYLQHAFENQGLKVKQDLYAKDLKDYSVEDFSTLGAVLDQQVSKVKANIGVFFSMSNISMDVQNNIMSQLDEFTFRDKNFYEEKTAITRTLLQLYGTNIARNRFDDQFWVKRCAERITADTEHDVIIITDVRFPNEISDIYDFIDDDMRVVPIRIERDIPRHNIAKEHASETALDDFVFEFVVDNNGTLNDLLGSSNIVSEDILMPD